MRLRLLNYGLGLALLASLPLHWMLPGDSAGRNADFLPDMVRTVRYAAFAPNPNFPDGKTLRLPEPGAIPRELPPLHYAATPEDAARAGAELHNPFPPGDAAAVARGKSLFQNDCQPCHGAGARGDGPVVLRGFPAPPPLMAEHAVGLPDGQIFHILTYGQKNMASYASQLSREDRWRLVLFVRSLQQQAQATPAQAAAGGTQEQAQPAPAPAAPGGSK